MGHRFVEETIYEKGKSGNACLILSGGDNIGGMRTTAAVILEARPGLEKRLRHAGDFRFPVLPWQMNSRMEECATQAFVMQ